MGFIEQLVGLLRGPQKSSHEHVINLLRTFVTDFPLAINECHRPEFDLENLLTSIIAYSMEDDPDLHQVHVNIELKYCNVFINVWNFLRNFHLNTQKNQFPFTVCIGGMVA